MDAGTATDMGPSDMGASSDGGGVIVTDMGKIGPGPWPLADVTIYGSAQGLGGGIIDANPDEGQNIWAANGETLYVLRPGSSTFQAFTAADGLHIQAFTDAYGQPNETRITAIAGGRANEVMVGYYGYETLGNPYLDTDAQKALGNGDHVTVGSDGTLAIVRYGFRCDFEGYNGCWENRSPRRIVYVHSGVAAGRSFWGFNHGVSHVADDVFGDHVHPEVWYHNADGTTTEKIGEFFGLAVLPTGDVWMAGRYGVGLQPFNATSHQVWVQGHFIYAFTTNTSDHSLDVVAGYTENNRGAAVTADGTLWLARLGGGLVSWDPRSNSYNTIRPWPQVPSDLIDVQADPDGTLWLVDSSGALLRFDPASGALQTWPGVAGVTRIYVDSTVTPRAVYASLSSGVAVIRAK
ncbi:MAG TPA: hypothetical protein VHB97_03600 [Polyangia bacterium]|nr:hypothetical protein [Polyangia bacterium]